MMMRFEGQTALVTGASSGMGQATAQMLANQGARVFTAQRGEAAHEVILADFADPATPEKVIAHIAQAAGRLDILINNAGVMREGTVDEGSEDDWHLQLQVNLTAPYLLIRHAMPLLKQGGGAIVNVGSIEGLGSNPRHPAYCASKAGLHGLTRAVAVDHGPDGVRCNAVAPGWIDTPLNVDFINSMGDPDQFRKEIGHIHPIRRTGAPEEVARLICWLASDDASFVTGQIYTIDGGRTAQLSLP
ncbi:SDR family NAD(P)-dependent oxidoreductase [Roseovarius aestuarii]|uniref:3-oxoacyl-[acyl-carrier-protein] reductase FabG n=1 Tax=Roseovarius aestuarii TaxID=475083 RepID=A0A1X7BRI4_9RHOB|nr:SDR family oxidoreductase [Roseovarius aestuarii]SMC12296.1 3-oxoacyl-[acyl-carrier-protein] reductase FabG [Roseovarius aestuarii]